MPQTLPAALVAPTRASQTVGYQIRAVDGTTIATAFTTTGVTEVSNTGYYRVNGGITAPDDGGTLEWYISNAGSAGTFLSAVTIEPAPNQADQAAGIRAALGLASANVDTQLSAINSKTTNLPAAPAAVGDIPTTTQIWTHATRALTDKDNFNLASSQTFSTTGSVGSVTGAVGSVTSPVTAGTVSDKTNYSLSSSQTFNLTGNITGNLSGSVGSVTGAVGSVTGSVGSVTGAVTVGTINNNVITANAIATDAFDADAIAASAVTEIQAGLATQASVDTKASQASVDALPTAPTIADAVWDETLGTRANGTTGKKLADASTLTVGDIPAGLTAQQVWEYATRALTDKTNFNLANDAITSGTLANSAITEIQANLATASSISTPAQIASQVRTELATELARINVDLSTRLAAANYTTPPTTAQIATAVEAALLNDADGQALLAAIQAAVQALFDQQADVPVATLVSLIAAQITADHGSGSYTTANVSALALEATAQAIKAKTDNLPSDPADQSELAALISAIPTVAPDNAGIAAIKAKTDNLPSDPADQSELATLISAIPTVAPDNAGIAAIKAKTDNLPSDPADQSELTTLISAIPTTPLLAANYTAPDNAGIAAIKAKTDNLPSDPADQSELTTLISAIPTAPLLAANYTAPDNAGIAAIKAKTDNLPSDPADQSELATLISAIPTIAPDNAGIAAIKAKTDNLPSDPADQSELASLIAALPSASTIANSVWNATLSSYTGPGSTGAKLNLASTLTVGDIPAGLTAQQVWEYATRTLSTASGLTTEQNTRLNELWRKAQLDNSNPVVRTRNLSTGAVTETLGQTGIQIVHAVTNDGNTVTSTRQS